MLITAFYSVSGVPSTGLTPTIDIRNIATGALVITAGNMTEVGSGWYKYDFTTAVAGVDYVFVCDGGSGLTSIERYVAGSTDDAVASTVAAAVWDELESSHVAAGSMGLLLGNLNDVDMAVSDIPTKAENAAAVWDALETSHVAAGSMGLALSQIRQIETGKWAIVGNTMTLYADNGTTVIKAFTITDKHGHAIALDDGAPASRVPV